MVFYFIRFPLSLFFFFFLSVFIVFILFFDNQDTRRDMATGVSSVGKGILSGKKEGLDDKIIKNNSLLLL